MSAATPAENEPASLLPPDSTAELPDRPPDHESGIDRSTLGKTWNHVGVKLMPSPKKSLVTASTLAGFARYASLPLKTAAFCVTDNQRFHTASACQFAESNSGVLLTMPISDSTPCNVLPRAPGASPLIAVVATEPAVAAASGAGSTVTGVLCSGMLCRWLSSAPTLMPATFFDRLSPMMSMSRP